MVNYQDVVEQFLVKESSQLESIARKMLQAVPTNKIWLFEGEMGAGKTTLIKALCAEKGVIDQVTSPTYTLIHEYRDQVDLAYYHFDFYRLNKVQEAIDIGCEEYFESGHTCFIEWPGLVRPLLPDRCVRVEIEVQPDNSRLIKLFRHD